MVAHGQDGDHAIPCNPLRLCDRNASYLKRFSLALAMLWALTEASPRCREGCVSLMQGAGGRLFAEDDGRLSLPGRRRSCLFQGKELDKEEEVHSVHGVRSSLLELEHSP